MVDVCCSICIIKQQTTFGSELSFITFSHFTSTLGHCIHQVLHQIAPNTIHHFRIEQFESTRWNRSLRVHYTSHHNILITDCDTKLGRIVRHRQCNHFGKFKHLETSLVLGSIMVLNWNRTLVKKFSSQAEYYNAKAKEWLKAKQKY